MDSPKHVCGIEMRMLPSGDIMIFEIQAPLSCGQDSVPCSQPLGYVVWAELLLLARILMRSFKLLLIPGFLVSEAKVVSRFQYNSVESERGSVDMLCRRFEDLSGRSEAGVHFGYISRTKHYFTVRV